MPPIVFLNLFQNYPKKNYLSSHFLSFFSIGGIRNSVVLSIDSGSVGGD